MKLNRLYIVLALVATVVGCSKENPSTVGVELSDCEIAFISDPNSPLAAKGAQIEEFEQVESIGVFAFHDNSDYINNSPLVQEVEEEQEYWVFSPSQKWPSTGTVGFVAYSPYQNYVDSYDAGFGVGSNYVNTLYISYSMPEDVSLHKDLLVAYSEGSNGDVVNLWFNHALATVSFKVRDDQQVDLINQELTLSGIFDTATLSVTSTGFSWGGLGSSMTKSYTTGYVSAPQGVSSELVSDENYIMVPPQTIPSIARINTQLSDGTELEYTPSGSWLAGNNYTYVIYVAADGSIEVDSVEVTPWETQDDEDTQDYNPTDGNTVGAEADEWSEEEEQTMEFI